MQKLLIFPYNGNAIEAVDCIANSYELIGFIDDTKEKQGLQKNGFRVYSREAFDKYPEAKILAVPGSYLNYYLRKSIINGLMIKNTRYATVIHPKACVSPLAEIGVNVLIMAGVVVTSNTTIGSHICILPNTVIHHDSIIEDYCIVGANVTLAGNVKVHKNCYIGSGSSIINGIEIGEQALIGLGTNVIKSIPGHTKAVGNPARIIDIM